MGLFGPSLGTSQIPFLLGGFFVEKN